MFIVSKEKDAIYNRDFITSIFIEKNSNIRIKFSNSDNRGIANYNSKQESMTALEMLINHINSGSKGVFYMPDEEQIKARMILKKEQWYHAKGKKTKGYGGS